MFQQLLSTQMALQDSPAMLVSYSVRLQILQQSRLKTGLSSESPVTCVTEYRW